MSDDPQNPRGYPNLGAVTVTGNRIIRYETRMVCGGCGEVIADSGAPCPCYPEGFPPPDDDLTDRI